MGKLTKAGKLYFVMAIALATIFLASVVTMIVMWVKASTSTDIGFDLEERNVVRMATDADNNRIAGTQDGELLAFSEDGDALWDLGKLRESAVYEIAVGGGRVYAVYADGCIVTFSEEDALAYGAGEEGEAFSAFRSYPLEYSISGNIANTQLLLGEGEFYLRAKCNDGSNRNYIFRFTEENPEPKQVRRSAGNFLLGGMAYCGGEFYYSYRGQLLPGNGRGALVELDEDILALSSRGPEISMITAGGKLVVYDTSAGEICFTEALPVQLDNAYVFSTGENFFAKIKNGGVAYIDTQEREAVLRMGADNDANLILWNDECFLLRDTSDVTAPELIFYTVEFARLKGLFSDLRWVFLALAIVAAIAAVICFLCVREERRAQLKEWVVKTAKSVWRDKYIYLALLLPFALLITFYYVPIVLGFSISFMDYVPGERSVFEGFKYFGMVVRSTVFWESFGTMLLFLVADLLKALIPPFIIAELLITLKLKRFSLWIRILLFLPGILPGIAATLVWQQGIFGASTNSLLNAFIKLFAPSFTGLNWINNPSYGVRVLSIICFGFPWVGSYLIFFGALGGINTSIFEAAKLDGCPWIKRVFMIDIPLILSQFKYVLITTFIASVQNYGTLYILYGTGTGDTLRTPALLMYGEIMAGNYNLASVMGVILFIFLAVVTVLNFRSQREQIE